MKLETLKGIESIGGFKVVEVFEREDGKYQTDYTEGEHNPILINYCDNSIQFFIQNEEAGIKGCSVETLIETAKLLFEKVPNVPKQYAEIIKFILGNEKEGE